MQKPSSLWVLTASVNRPLRVTAVHTRYLQLSPAVTQSAPEIVSHVGWKIILTKKKKKGVTDQAMFHLREWMCLLCISLCGKWLSVYCVDIHELFQNGMCHCDNWPPGAMLWQLLLPFSERSCSASYGAVGPESIPSQISRKKYPLVYSLYDGDAPSVLLIGNYMVTFFTFFLLQPSWWVGSLAWLQLHFLVFLLEISNLVCSVIASHLVRAMLGKLLHSGWLFRCLW